MNDADVVQRAVDAARDHLAEIVEDGIALTNVRYHGPTDTLGARYSFHIRRASDLGKLDANDVRMIAVNLYGKTREVDGGWDIRVTIPYPYEGFRAAVESALPTARILIEREGALAA